MIGSLFWKTNTNQKNASSNENEKPFEVGKKKPLLKEEMISECNQLKQDWK